MHIGVNEFRISRLGQQQAASVRQPDRLAVIAVDLLQIHQKSPVAAVETAA